MFTFRINGGAVEKNFAREFIRFVCGGDAARVDRRVDWVKCTRKRLVVISRRLADTLQKLDGRVYWPDGRPFHCKLLHRTEGETRDRRQRRRQRHYYRTKYDREPRHARHKRITHDGEADIDAITFTNNVDNNSTKYFKHYDYKRRASDNANADWYDSGNLVNVELCHDDDNDNAYNTDVDFLRQEINMLNV
ncbi:LEF6 [Orgyia pseudotsugata single capsid nuclopolyhedrovirus]|nr:LEF6 [Orgyia pseudotsugata single capsid nuclopolyhedrovirus]